MSNPQTVRPPGQRRGALMSPGHRTETRILEACESLRFPIVSPLARARTLRRREKQDIEYQSLSAGSMWFADLHMSPPGAW